MELKLWPPSLEAHFVPGATGGKRRREEGGEGYNNNIKEGNNIIRYC
jgi:hypothetical protein